MNPLDYSLCCQRVTLYRKTGERVQRKVVDNCHLSCLLASTTESYGKSRVKQFLLIIPGQEPLLPGDRIYAGVGPEAVTWESFVPALVPELFEIAYARPCLWDGEVIHWEAGSGKGGW